MRSWPALTALWECARGDEATTALSRQGLSPLHFSFGAFFDVPHKDYLPL